MAQVYIEIFFFYYQVPPDGINLISCQNIEKKDGRKYTQLYKHSQVMTQAQNTRESFFQSILINFSIFFQPSLFFSGSLFFIFIFSLYNDVHRTQFSSSSFQANNHFFLSPFFSSVLDIPINNTRCNDYIVRTTRHYTVVTLHCR